MKKAKQKLLLHINLKINLNYQQQLKKKLKTFNILMFLRYLINLTSRGKDV